MPPRERPSLPLPPSFDERAASADPASAVRALVAARRSWFEQALAAGCDPIEIARGHGDIVDRTVTSLFRRAVADLPPGSAARTALLALGGYGRREMGLASDVDLLFLIEPDAAGLAATITDGVLYPLWDGGIETGGATRTIADCRSALEHDARALTAMLDARLVSGSGSLHQELVRLIAAHFAPIAARRRFAEQKIREQQERLARAAAGSVLEPNVKEGEGGIRDVHTLLWIARAQQVAAHDDELLRHAVPDRASRETLEASLGFIWGVRHALHLAQGGRTDRLAEGVQEEVASRLGIRADVDGTAAERLMSLYHRHARALHLGAGRAVELLRRELAPQPRLSAFLRRRRLGRGFVRTEHRTIALLPGRPITDQAALELFAESRSRGLAVDPAVRATIAAAGRRLGETARADLDAARHLRAIFAGIRGLDGALAGMQECGLLERWFPEMGPMLHRVQRDGFHYYTAGNHSIRAVAELSSLTLREGRRSFPVPARALAAVKRPRVLALAMLFHDIGKGRGGDHAQKGAVLARTIARRMGLADQDAADIEFLVRSHLLMATLAFRRDVRDPAMVARFAQSFRSPELLAMLYLITFADLRAVGPHVWSDWKGGLLAELYERTRERLSAAGAASAKTRDEARFVRAVRRSLGRDVEEAAVSAFLARLPERYAHAMSPESVAAHFMMARELPHRPVATLVREVPERGCTELSVVTHDAPGLFARIAGVLSANGANIIDAELATADDGTAVDVLWLTDPLHHPFDDPDRWERIRAELVEAIEGTRRIEEIVGGRFRRRLLAWSAQPRPADIAIDNDVSALHTVIEVSADDRRGLLYTIASTFHELGCSIDLARISTHVDRVTDVFYIRDEHGRKIDARERLEKIRQRLREAVEE